LCLGFCVYKHSDSQRSHSGMWPSLCEHLISKIRCIALKYQYTNKGHEKYATADSDIESDCGTAKRCPRVIVHFYIQHSNAFPYPVSLSCKERLHKCTVLACKMAVFFILVSVMLNDSVKWVTVAAATRVMFWAGAEIFFWDPVS